MKGGTQTYGCEPTEQKFESFLAVSAFNVLGGLRGERPGERWTGFLHH